MAIASRYRLDSLHCCYQSAGQKAIISPGPGAALGSVQCWEARATRTVGTYEGTGVDGGKTSHADQRIGKAFESLPFTTISSA